MPKDQKNNSDHCKYYVSEIENTLKQLVIDLEKHVNLSGRNISCDKLYSSIPLAKGLLEKIISIIGTIQANRKEIPQELKTCASRETGSYEVY